MVKKNLLVAFSVMVLVALFGGTALAMVLNGAGATFPYPIYSKWMFEYNKKTGVQITEDQGHSKYEGVTFSWAWGGTDLVVDIVSVSFGDEIIGETEQKVMGQFAAWIDGVQ